MIKKIDLFFLFENSNNKNSLLSLLLYLIFFQNVLILNFYLSGTFINKYLIKYSKLFLIFD